MPLTDAAIRSAKSGAKPIRLFDGGVLYLEVSPRGRQAVALEVSIPWEGKAACAG